MFADLASAAGVVVAVAAFIAGMRANRKTHELQLRVLAIEEARLEDAKRRAVSAQIIVRSVKARPGVNHLVLGNSGMAPARNVSVMFDGVPCASHPAGGLIREMPSVIAPACEVSLPLLFTLGIEPIRVVRVSWIDSTGANCEMETALP